jgi:phosphoribosylpyrophosphate synthetase
MLHIAACRGGPVFAKNAIACYDRLLRENGSDAEIRLDGPVDGLFSDGEIRVRLGRRVGGSDPFLVQSLYTPASDMRINENYLSLT